MTSRDDETWETWNTRIARELAQLSEDGWMTFVVHVDSGVAVAQEVAKARKGWRRALAPPPHPPVVPDVFMQARRLEGLLALECIGDAEFEGLTDLTDHQQETLLTLGWEREGADPDFSATFEMTEAEDAADLLAASLRGVLGAATPSRVDVRHSNARSTAH
jgi:hypothetical protein